MGYIIVFVLVVMVYMANNASLVSGEVNVTIKNEIENPEKLITVHCKDKHRDVGKHNLSHGQSFDFKIKVNIWRTTLYWCHLDWNRSSGRQPFHFSLVVFNAEQPDGLPYNTKIEWSIKRDGIWSLRMGAYQIGTDYLGKESWQKFQVLDDID